MFRRLRLKMRIKQVDEDITLIDKQHKRLIKRPKLSEIPEKLEHLENLHKQRRILERFKTRLFFKLNKNIPES